MRTLILGLGNTLLADDGAGVYAARAAAAMLEARRASRPPPRGVAVVIREAELGGFALVELIEGFHRAVIIDAIKVAGATAGSILELAPSALTPASHLCVGHQIDLPTALRLGAELGRPMPASVRVLAVQIVDDTTVRESLSDAVAPAIPAAARRALDLALADSWADDA